MNLKRLSVGVTFVDSKKMIPLKAQGKAVLFKNNSCGQFSLSLSAKLAFI